MPLPDVLEPKLKVVFCGTAVGPVANRLQAYYAGPGNRFWWILHEVGLTPWQLEPQEYGRVREFGIGLTDLAKRTAATDPNLVPDDFDVGALSAKIRQYAPRALAFNGKRAAQEFLDHSAEYGRQQETSGTTALFVLPSTSARARRYWDESYWFELADFVA